MAFNASQSAMMRAFSFSLTSFPNNSLAIVVYGVLMFRPLPKHLKADQDMICNRLDPRKDIDGMKLRSSGRSPQRTMAMVGLTPLAFNASQSAMMRALWWPARCP